MAKTMNRLRQMISTGSKLGFIRAVGILAVFCCAALASDGGMALGPVDQSYPIPVAYVSDIGDDIDDTWALGFVLKCPELDLRLVVTDQGMTRYRGRLFGRFLEAAGRTDVPIALGPDVNLHGEGPIAEWIREYPLERYPGIVHEDGVQALIDLIMTSERSITVIAVGPVPTVAAALNREPRIAQRARFVGMHGSLRRGFGADAERGPVAEYNVAADVGAIRTVFAAPWPVTITPLDTCGRVYLDGELYQRVLRSPDPVARAIIENYRLWAPHQEWVRDPVALLDSRTSHLYDTVAVFLAFRGDGLKIEELDIHVTDQGMTIQDPKGRRMRVATEWTDLQAFRELLVERLIGPTVGARKNVSKLPVCTRKQQAANQARGALAAKPTDSMVSGKVPRWHNLGESGREPGRARCP
jgi:inosine-uridine nucleoside N-ribohydrolase